MTSGTDYIQQYGKANAAYCRGDLNQAASIIESMARDYPEDPNVLLLRGHIFLGLHKYDWAREQYELVLQLSEQRELLDYARRGLQQIQQLENQPQEMEDAGGDTGGNAVDAFNWEGGDSFADEDDFPDWEPDGGESSWAGHPAMEDLDWESDVFSDEDIGEPTIGQFQPFANPFDNGDLGEFSSSPNTGETFQVSPVQGNEFDDYGNPFADDHGNDTGFSHMSDGQSKDRGFTVAQKDIDQSGFLSSDDLPEREDSTFVVSSSLQGSSLKSSPPNGPVGDLLPDHANQGKKAVESHGFLDDLEVFNEDDLEGLSQFDITDVAQSLPDSGIFERSHVDLDSGLDLNSVSDLSSQPSISKINWDDTGEISPPSLASKSERLLKPTVEVDQGKLAPFKNLPLRKKQLITSLGAAITSVVAIFLVSSVFWIFGPKSTPQKNSSSSNNTSTVPSSTKGVSPGSKTPNVASSPQKATEKETAKGQNKATAKEQNKSQSSAVISPFSQSMLLMMLVTGLSTFIITLILTEITTNHVKHCLSDLQTQFDAIYQGNFNVKATVYSEDEFGQLSARFNQMAQAILTTTLESQRRVAETEQAQADLQRQVIRLLDDVEGSARGDLTVEAEVTADVLGAVADAFNLTIQSLREIVRQVKKAAEQVNRGSTDSELYARNQSSDALRMAEELAVTLNSVQMMTESIQRVAENAREAEEVARSSSVTALKGGEAVERTVAGVLQIRETVSETARKVKRLAEASQEISKIVAVISQIASRTNLLALNASIQAARAGEAGRGFAIVADEVRQLADRSAKSLKEIEQIVLQIQSETGSVMTAMEEGIQQVIDVAERSEQAKRALEDIIQVANRIDALVRSITADTVRQRENSREVAQVMQSVELTAQETSQESQRVAGSLQKLVKISRDLLESVERFKVEK